MKAQRKFRDNVAPHAVPPPPCSRSPSPPIPPPPPSSLPPTTLLSAPPDLPTSTLPLSPLPPFCPSHSRALPHLPPFRSSIPLTLPWRHESPAEEQATAPGRPARALLAERRCLSTATTPRSLLLSDGTCRRSAAGCAWRRLAGWPRRGDGRLLKTAPVAGDATHPARGHNKEAIHPSPSLSP